VKTGSHSQRSHTFEPEDETAFCVFRAESAALVQEAYRRAGVGFERSEEGRALLGSERHQQRHEADNFSGRKTTGSVLVWKIKGSFSSRATAQATVTLKAICDGGRVPVALTLQGWLSGRDPRGRFATRPLRSRAR
jgi:hypothetical protein